MHHCCQMVKLLWDNRVEINEGELYWIFVDEKQLVETNRWAGIQAEQTY